MKCAVIPIHGDPWPIKTFRLVVFTDGMRERLGLINNAVRALKSRGLTVRSLTVTPPDGGSAILHLGEIDPRDAEYLTGNAECCVSYQETGAHRVTITGVRIAWWNK